MRTKRTPEQFSREMHLINPDIEILGTYTKAQDAILARCSICGKEWEPRAYRLLQGSGCPSCAHKKGARKNKGKTGLKDLEQFKAELNCVNPSINVFGEYINTHTNIRVSCTRCGNVWEAKPYSLLQGHGCPRCAKSGTSFMEQVIYLSFRTFLGKQVISRDKNTIGMELDVFIPARNLAIEIGNWYLHRKSIKRDAEKRKRCQERGIRLITIYDRYPKNQAPIFEKDFLSFEDDLNKIDHATLRELVQNLFNIAYLDHRINDDEWSNIEQEAYENSKAMVHEDFVKRMQDIHPTIEILGKYENTNRKLKVRCLSCGYIWEGIPANMLSGDGCRKCGTKAAHKYFVKDPEKFTKEVAEKNPDIEVIGKYIGRHSPVRVRCKVCGFEWSPRASSILRGSSHKGSKTIHKRMAAAEKADNAMSM